MLRRKKQSSDLYLEVPKETDGLFPEFLNALSIMSCFILVVVFYRGVEAHIKTTTTAEVTRKIQKAETPKIIARPEVKPAAPVVEKAIEKPVPKVIVEKKTTKTKDITSVKSVFSFTYKKQNAVSVDNFNFFRPSSFKVSKGGKKRLRKIAPFLKGKKILIHGHTDPIPAKFVPAREWNTNKALSQFRAKSIKKYLTTQGLNPKSIKIGNGRKIRRKDKEGTRGATFILLD